MPQIVRETSDAQELAATQAALVLVLFCEANFTEIADGCAGLQVGLTDVVQVARGASELTRPANYVRWIADEGETRRRKWNGGRNGGTEEDVVAGFRDPVVLDTEEDCVVLPRLWRSQQTCRNGTSQVASCWAQSSVGINGSEISDNAAPDVNAVVARKGLQLILSRRTTAAAGKKCGK